MSVHSKFKSLTLLLCYYVILGRRHRAKAETIKRLSPMSKYHYFSHFGTSGVQKFFLSPNDGGHQYFSVFHGLFTLKSMSPALC